MTDIIQRDGTKTTQPLRLFEVSVPDEKYTVAAPTICQAAKCVPNPDWVFEVACIGLLDVIVKS